MGPIMPPGKKAEGPSSGSEARGLSQLLPDGEAADLSFSLSASLSRAEDEELTSLSWLHETSDLLTSLGHPGLRSVSPVQDGSSPDSEVGSGGGSSGGGGRGLGHDQSHRSPSSSPEPSEGGAYDLSSGPNRKPPYSFSCLIFMAIEDAPNKRLPVKDIYGWILEHFPYFASAPTGWKNSVRHNLSLNKCFKKVDKDRSQSIGKGSLWSIDPEYRHNLIQALKKTPYHPYSPRLSSIPSTSPPTSPQPYHSPLWPGSPLFKKNGEVLLQVPPKVIPNGTHMSSQGVFPVIRPLHISPVGSRTSTIRSTLGGFLTKDCGPSLSNSPSASDSDTQEDHTYSSAKEEMEEQGGQPGSPSPPSSSMETSVIKVEVKVETKEEERSDEAPLACQAVKQEPQDIPLDTCVISPQQQQQQQQQQALRRRLLWVKGRPRTLGETLPLKKRRAAEKPPDSDDEEMKEAAGSLLHLAGVRSCLNNITNRKAKGQKEQKERDAQRN